LLSEHRKIEWGRDDPKYSATAAGKFPRPLSYITPPSGISRADSLNVGIFGQLVYNVLISGFSLHVQSINIGVKIVFALVFHMEVDIQHAHTNGLEIVVDKGDSFHAMNKLDFHMFNGIDPHQALQQRKCNDYD